nr:P-loop NTPase [Candidatus Sigynarchaeota archaeon]
MVSITPSTTHQEAKHPKVIGVSGGKGGTGKSFVGINLAIALSSSGRVLLVDADVDNPNDAIILGQDTGKVIKNIECFIPKIDPNACTKCGKCSDSCRFHALFYITDKVPTLIQPLCKSCELCRRVCPSGAISGEREDIGQMMLCSFDGIDLLTGKVIPGSPKSTFIVKAENEYVWNVLIPERKYDYILIDTAPGTHCDIENALEETDVVICVTEPTPLGAHDLGRILELCKILKKKTHVVINRSTMASFSDKIRIVAEQWGSSVIASIPLSRDAMVSYAQGKPIMKRANEPGTHQEIVRAFHAIEKVIKE